MDTNLVNQYGGEMLAIAQSLGADYKIFQEMQMLLDVIQASWKEESESDWDKFKILHNGQPVTLKVGSQYGLTQAYLHICSFTSLQQKFDFWWVHWNMQRSSFEIK